MTTQETVTLCPDFLAHLRANANRLKSLDWLEQHVKVCPICRAMVEEEETGEDLGSSNQERKDEE